MFSRLLPHDNPRWRVGVMLWIDLIMADSKREIFMNFNFLSKISARDRKVHGAHHRRLPHSQNISEYKILPSILQSCTQFIETTLFH